MKGKYANAAEKRREMDALYDSERHLRSERDSLAGKCASMAAEHERKTAAMSARIASLEHDREAVASPALAAANETIAALRAQMEKIRTASARTSRSNLRLIQLLASAATIAGFRNPDARFAAAMVLDPDDVDELASTKRKKAANRRMGVKLTEIHDRRAGFDTSVAEMLACFFDALAEGRFRQEGNSLILDDWNTWGAKEAAQ